MLIGVLYLAAAFLETAIGIWIFGQIFPKRHYMEKRHVAAEWVLFTILMAGAYTFPKAIWNIDGKQGYLEAVIGIYCLSLMFWAVCKIWKKRLGETENRIIQCSLICCMIVWISMQYWVSYMSGGVVLFGNIVPVLFLYSFYQCKIIQAYIWELFYLTNMGLIKGIYITYEGTFKRKYFEEFIYFPRNHTYGESIYLLMVCFVILLIVRHISLKEILCKILCKYEKSLLIIAVCEFGILEMLVHFGNGKINEKYFMLNLLAVTGIVFMLLILYVKSFMRAMEVERNLLAVRNDIMEQQYKELDEAYNKYRCLVHDEKHMILYLLKCLEAGETDEAKKFLSGYEKDLNSEGKCSCTGIVTLDFMLNIKKNRMDKLKVDFDLDCRIEYIPMEDTDFIVLLGNLLDNSIEAVKKCVIENRKIRLSIYNINQMFILKINNTNVVKPYVKRKRFITDKEEKNKHGWGIESVKRIVAKYNGYLSFQYDNTFFEAAVIISEEDKNQTKQGDKTWKIEIKQPEICHWN